MDQIVSSAIDLCTFIYLGVGIAGYLAFAGTSFTGNSFISKYLRMHIFLYDFLLLRANLKQ